MNRTERAGAAAKVAVVGAGLVGATSAYSITLRGLASELLLIDSNRERAEGEAMDLNHALPFGRPARIRAGDYPDALRRSADPLHGVLRDVGLIPSPSSWACLAAASTACVWRAGSRGCRASGRCWPGGRLPGAPRR